VGGRGALEETNSEKDGPELSLLRKTVLGLCGFEDEDGGVGDGSIVVAKVREKWEEAEERGIEVRDEEESKQRQRGIEEAIASLRREVEGVERIISETRVWPSSHPRSMYVSHFAKIFESNRANMLHHRQFDIPVLAGTTNVS
jgi:hypothetical protein